MAKALQCPNCKTRRRIDTLQGRDTFECEGCGQVTKVPPGIGADHRPARASRSKAGPAAGPVASSESAPPAPPKRRARTGVAAAAGTGAGTAAMPVPPPDAPGGGVAVAAPPVRGRGERRAKPMGMESFDDAPRQPKVYWRVLAWLVALPIALAAVGIPARRAGYLNSQRLLDVIVDKDITRFVPVLVIIVLWALVTAVLVTAMLSLGERLAARRRRRRSS